MSKLPPLFHASFGSRLQTEFCRPKGPDFKRANRVRFGIDGNFIELLAPKHKAASYYHQIKPRSNYKLKELNLEYIEVNNEGWQVLYPFKRSWGFYGPWFTGWMGQTDIVISIVGPKKLKDRSSFFHPQGFENALADYLTSWLKGDDLREGYRQRWVAPVDWQAINHFSCIAATFDIHGDEQERGDISRCLAFPLSDNLLCVITLKVYRSLAFVKSRNVPESNTDNWISDQPMIELADNILSSVKLTLSPEAEAQQAKALEGLDNPHLSETFAPLNWGPEGGSEINDCLLAEFIQEHEAKKRKKLTQ